MNPVRRLLLSIALAALAGAAVAAEPARLLVRHAMLVTLEAAQPDPFAGYLLVGADGRIAALGAGEPPAGMTATETVDAGGNVVMPGFLSGHSHLWQSAFRGISAGSRAWRAAIHGTYGPHFQTGDVRAFSLHGALDYLRHGITTTYNYSQNLDFSPELNEEQYTAELEAGGRFIFGYALIPRPSMEVVRANFAKFYARVKAAHDPLVLGINFASSGVGTAITDDYLKFEFQMMADFGLGMSMHYLEQPATIANNRETFARIEKLNGLSPRLCFAHFIHADDYIVARSGAAGVGMSWNPLSNGRLANGVVDIPKYRKAGVKIGMGIDGQASADISDPFENMRMGLYGVRNLYKDPAALLPIDVLRFHTIGTAEVFGVADEVGTLKVGKFADFLLVDPAEPDTGPVADLYATLVFACNVTNVRRIYVGGQLVALDGRLTGHDFPALSREVQQRVQAVREREAAARAAKKS